MLGVVPTTFVGSHTAPSVCNLVYTSGIYVQVNNFENNNVDTGTSNQSSTCLLRVPINQPSNTYLQYFNNVGFKTLLNTTVINQLDISLLDDRRQPIQLTDNVDWTCVLRIDYEKTVVETAETTKISLMKQGIDPQRGYAA